MIKRKLESLDLFVTITKKTIVMPSSSEQAESEQSALIIVEAAETIDTKFEKPDAINSFDINPNLNVIDSYASTHEIDIGFQLSLRITFINETKYRLLRKLFQSDQKCNFPGQNEYVPANLFEYLRIQL